jgi:hypothetical protein
MQTADLYQVITSATQTNFNTNASCKQKWEHKHFSCLHHLFYRFKQFKDLDFVQKILDDKLSTGNAVYYISSYEQKFINFPKR